MHSFKIFCFLKNFSDNGQNLTLQISERPFLCAAIKNSRNEMKICDNVHVSVSLNKIITNNTFTCY